MNTGEKVFFGSIVFWLVCVLCFMLADLLSWFVKGKIMAGTTGGSTGNVLIAGGGGGTVWSTTGGGGSGKSTFQGDVVIQGSIRGGLRLDDTDVGYALKLLTFFLQSRHPEIFEEFEAIRKIEES